MSRVVKKEDVWGLAWKVWGDTHPSPDTHPFPQFVNYLKTEFGNDREQSILDDKGLASNLSAVQLFHFLRISQTLASQAPTIQTRDRLLPGWLSVYSLVTEECLSSSAASEFRQDGGCWLLLGTYALCV